MGQRHSALVTFGSNCEYRYGRTDAVGKGGFGTVYKATITKRGKYAGQKTVAIKEIRLFSEELEQFSNEETKKTLEKRWKLLLQLKNPNVVPYHKITLLNGTHLVIVEFLMDYYEDGELSSFLKWLKKIRRPLRHMISYGKQITHGLQYLHQQHIIHGDLKPSNILIRRLPDGSRTLAIGDLDDLVQMQASVTCSGDMHGLRGTFRYMSPEMLQKFTGNNISAHVGRMTDIWSLECILLDMAESCFQLQERWLIKDSTQETLRLGDDCPTSAFIIRIVDGYVPYVPVVIPEDIRTIMRMCLSLSHVSRPSADAVAQLLDGVLWDNISTSNHDVSTWKGWNHSINLEDIIGKGNWGLIDRASAIYCRQTYPGQYSNPPLVLVRRFMTHVSNSRLSAMYEKETTLEIFALSGSLLHLQNDNIMLFHRTVIKEFEQLLAVGFLLDFYPDENLSVYLQHLRHLGLTIFEIHALDSFRQIVSGLQFLHQNRISHGNLAMEGVFTKLVINNGRNFAIGDWDEAVISQQELATTNLCTLRNRSRDRFSCSSDNVPCSLAGSHMRNKYASDIETLGYILLEVSTQIADGEQYTWLPDTDSEVRKRQLMTDHSTTDNFSTPSSAQQMDKENLRNVISLCFQTNASAEIVLAATDTDVPLAEDLPPISSTVSCEKPVAKNKETGSGLVVWPL